MVLRRKTNAKVMVVDKLATKRLYSGHALPKEKEPPKPQEQNPWAKRREGKKVQDAVVAEKGLEEDCSAGEEEWREVKARKRGGSEGVVSPKLVRAPVGVVEPTAMEYELEWPLPVVTVGTPVVFRHLKRSLAMNGTSGVVVGVVEADRRFLVATSDGLTVSVVKEKLSIVEDDDILVVKGPQGNSNLVVKDVESEVVLTPRQNVEAAVVELTPQVKGGGGYCQHLE